MPVFTLNTIKQHPKESTALLLVTAFIAINAISVSVLLAKYKNKIFTRFVKANYTTTAIILCILPIFIAIMSYKNSFQHKIFYCLFAVFIIAAAGLLAAYIHKEGKLSPGTMKAFTITLLILSCCTFLASIYRVVSSEGRQQHLFDKTIHFSCCLASIASIVGFSIASANLDKAPKQNFIALSSSILVILFSIAVSLVCDRFISGHGKEDSEFNDGSYPVIDCIKSVSPFCPVNYAQYL